jgi:hypothetical protein
MAMPVFGGVGIVVIAPFLTAKGYRNIKSVVNKFLVIFTPEA